MPVVLLLAVASSFSLGVADYLSGVTLRIDERPDAALTYTALATALGAAVAVLALPFVTPDSFTSRDGWWAVAAGCCLGVALPLLMVGISRGPIAIVAPVIGLAALAVPAILGPLLGDELSALEVAGLLLAFPAAALVAVSPAQPRANALPVAQAFGIAVTSGGFLGGAAICYGRTAPASGIGPGIVSQLTAAALLVGVALVWGRWLRPTVQASRPAAGFGALSGIATVLSVLAYQRGSVAIVAAVLGLAPGPTILLARFLDHEPINPAQLVGFAFGFGAVVLFALG
ncbi:MAG: hypothetical protein QNJ89_06010 [Acidimicrobiia bacterium]|nr:hypothetical protein [Acidimicrobiia bacterium]